ncbi:KxYKxGKxW signal peptide domain-containing protein, partial [Limosilactobacillus mucosae]|nr:KxYKxGKxW signal peptide domain-containing protein [Limosilactobacillus mucosae]
MWDYKKHFKMYKSGKLWIIAGITIGLLMHGNIIGHADTTDVNQGNQTTVTLATDATAEVQAKNSTAEDDSDKSSTASSSASTSVGLANSKQTTDIQSTIQSATTDAQTRNSAITNKSDAISVSENDQSQSVTATTSSTSSAVEQVQTGTLPANQVSGTTESYENGHWYLKDYLGNYLNGWQKLADNRIVYYDPQTNQMQYGEQQINGQWYFFNTSDGKVIQGWYTLPDGRLVYYDVANDGTGRGMLQGIQTIDGQTYDFNAANGAQVTGWESLDGQKYYFAPTMVHGMEKQISGHWYYFNDEGQMQTGFVRLKDGREVYYNDDGQMQYGEQKINNKWYHFQNDNGNMARGWYTLEDGRRVYYDLTADGQGAGMLHGLSQINNQSYFFDVADGEEKTGLQTIDNQTYYFDPIMVKNGEAKIGNYWYYFDENGKMQTGFVTLNDGRLVYYSDQGQMQYGEQKINNKWYHFQADNGNTARGWYTLEDGRRVYYDVHASGSGQGMLHGLGKVGNDYYYFNVWTGAEETGLKTINGNQYYFTSTMATNQEEHLGDHWYYFGADGKMQTGFVTLNDGRLVYYNEQGQMQYGEQKVNNK